MTNRSGVCNVPGCDVVPMLRVLSRWEGRPYETALCERHARGFLEGMRDGAIPPRGWKVVAVEVIAHD